MAEKSFIIGTTNQQIEAYDQAVSEGLIDPKKVSKKQFEGMSEEGNYGTFDPSIFPEIIRSAHNVANIMRKKK